VQDGLAQVQFGFLQNIHQSHMIVQLEQPRRTSPQIVAVDQQDSKILLHGHTDSQVDRCEGLSFSRHGTGHHDQIPVVDQPGLVTEGIVQQRALDHAILFSLPAPLVGGAEEALLLQSAEIDGTDLLQHPGLLSFGVFSHSLAPSISSGLPFSPAPWSHLLSSPNISPGHQNPTANRCM